MLILILIAYATQHNLLINASKSSVTDCIDRADNHLQAQNFRILIDNKVLPVTHEVQKCIASFWIPNLDLTPTLKSL